MLVHRRAWFTRPRPRRPQRRRFALEWLENRTLLSASTLDLAISPAPANVTDGTIITTDEVDSYSFSISAEVGGGSLRANVVSTSGGLIPRLTLSGPHGELLIQSDSGRIAQHLQPGSYSVSVSAQVGLGAYQLTTRLGVAEPPLSSLGVGTLPRSVALGDFNGDGILDVVAPNNADDTVSVLLGNGDTTFQPQQVIATGHRPISVTVADVNGDGQPDLLTANFRDYYSVSVLLGNGDGTFQLHAEIPVGGHYEGSVGVAVADLDGDGRPDLAVSNAYYGTISVLKGNGDGTFQPEETRATGYNLGPVVVADIDGDGILDLLAPGAYEPVVIVLHGNDDGTFVLQPPIPLGGATESRAASLAVADVNGDGQPDIAVSHYLDHSVSVLLGTGSGSFLPAQMSRLETLPYSIGSADVNGDGNDDIFTANFGDNSVSVLLGQSDGTLAAAKRFAAGKGVGGVALGDLDGDSRPDIVTANFSDKSLSVLLGRGDGTFATKQEPTPVPGLRTYSVDVADLNGDGRPDVVTANKGDSTVSVLLRNLDGSFQTRQTFPTGPSPVGAVVADVNGDGVPDIITSSYTDPSVSVLLGNVDGMGNGDGTFEAPKHFPTDYPTYALTVADVSGDGRPDILSVSIYQTLSVLKGNSDGSFGPPQLLLDVYGYVYGNSVAVGDVNGDGKPDIVTADPINGLVSILLGNGDDTFESRQDFQVDGKPFRVLVGDVDGDGQADDVVTTNTRENSVSVLLGQGGDTLTFSTPMVFPAGVSPDRAVLADFNSDGIPDLFTDNARDGKGNFFPGLGDGSFGDSQVVPLGSDAMGLAVTDFDGDGRSDVITGNPGNDSVAIALGNGDGTFQSAEIVGIGKNRFAATVADVNNDGKPDLIKSNLRDNTVSVELGTGNGSFEPEAFFNVGSQPTSVKVADLNGDGRPDLVTTNSDDDSVSVLLGNGDGSFKPNELPTFAVGRSPRAVIVADVNGDDVSDLVVANYNDGTVSVLLGIGDGSFREQQTFSVGQRPYSTAVADINGDGKVDLVAANTADDTVSVLLGNGDGTFQDQQTLATGRQPIAVTIADGDGDGVPDVMAANAFDNTVSVLLGNGDGSFHAASTFDSGHRPSSITVADINGDGQADLVTANFDDDNAGILLGNGNGTFQNAQSQNTNLVPTLTLAADINGDRRPDLVTVGNHDNTTGILLNRGNGEFRTENTTTDVGLRNTPLLADINGDGIADRVSMDRSGKILFRAGQPSSTFAPPVILNPDRPARDITILRTGSELSIAAADTSFDFDFFTRQIFFAVSLYDVSTTGAIRRRTAFSTTAPLSRLVTDDLTGDGVPDLIAINPLDNSVTIAFQSATGQFAARITMAVGNAPSDIAVADMNADGLPDVLVSNQGSGDVSILLNDAAHAFHQSLRFRAGTQPYSLDASADSPLVSSLAETVSLVAGEFTGDGLNDVVVVNRGAHSFTVLTGNDRGGFANPQVSLTASTSDGFAINERPGETVAGDFNRDGNLDLAVLMQDTGQLWIFSGNGAGSFEHTFTFSVGDQVTGLTVAPGSGNGLLDLLVGNGFGDVLYLEGNGDGTFQIRVNRVSIRGNRVSLSVEPDLFGPGQAAVLVGNQQYSRVTVQAPTSSGTGYSEVERLRTDNTSLPVVPDDLFPGDVQWSLLARDATLPDAVVVSTGGNAVIVYHTTSITDGAPVFASEPQTIFVGTAPASLTVADINGDDVPDMLVANRGSNDVSVIFGSFTDDGTWTGTPGPRLRSGGAGPIAVDVRELTGDDNPDLVVTNGSSGTITLLPGVGQGFFDDQQPQTLVNVGGAVDQTPTFQGDSGIGFAVTTAGELVRFDLSHSGNRVFAAFENHRVVAAQASSNGQGALPVFENQHVVAAEALDNGQVVVGLADGTVKVLNPSNDGFSVASELQALFDTPASLSEVVVLPQANGQFQVLGSSPGLDTVFVYGSASASTPVDFFIPTTTSSDSLFSARVAGDSQLISPLDSSFLGRSSSVTLGFSLSDFSSLDNLTFTADSDATLVALAGNTYSTVAVLDFGSQQDDLSGDGRGRMPWLSSRSPFGDTSPLTRFVIGLENAIEEFRRSVNASGNADETEGSSRDPWTEDFFHQRQPSRQRKARTKLAAETPQKEAPKEESQTEAPNKEPQTKAPKDDDLNDKQSRLNRHSSSDGQTLSDSYWERYVDDDHWLLPQAGVTPREPAFNTSPVVLAGLLLTRMQRFKDAKFRKIKQQTSAPSTLHS